MIVFIWIYLIVGMLLAFWVLNFLQDTNQDYDYELRLINTFNEAYPWAGGTILFFGITLLWPFGVFSSIYRSWRKP